MLSFKLISTSAASFEQPTRVKADLTFGSAPKNFPYWRH